MSQKNVWEVYFNEHAPQYMNNPFTYGTLKEVDFILEELNLPEGGKILDIGCGTCRHSIELARHGFVMTGVDLSSGMLAEAKQTAEEAGVEIELIQSNATDFTSDAVYDAAICLCEGAFCLLAAGEDHHEHDLSILKNIYSALKPGGKFILTALNGIKSIRQYTPDDIETGVWDPLTMTETHPLEGDTSGENLATRERTYVPSELVLLFKIAGFEIEHVYGGTAGNWGRRPVELDEMEIMVIARKQV